MYKMDLKAVEAKKTLEFLSFSLPDDDPKWKDVRDTFAKAIECLNLIKETAMREQHDALRKITPAHEECPCRSCKTERFAEVIGCLSRDQLLEIIASESGVYSDGDTETCAKVTAVAAGGAGSGGVSESKD